MKIYKTIRVNQEDTECINELMLNNHLTEDDTFTFSFQITPEYSIDIDIWGSNNYGEDEFDDLDENEKMENQEFPWVQAVLFRNAEQVSFSDEPSEEFWGEWFCIDGNTEVWLNLVPYNIGQ